MRLLPLALIPMVPVPLAIALHVVSLRRLRRPAASANGGGERRVAEDQVGGLLGDHHH